jgi:hypothetical protein
LPSDTPPPYFIPKFELGFFKPNQTIIGAKSSWVVLQFFYKKTLVKLRSFFGLEFELRFYVPHRATHGSKGNLADVADKKKT